MDKIIKELQPMQIINQFADINYILLEQLQPQIQLQQQQNLQDLNQDKANSHVTGSKLINNYRLCNKVNVHL